MFNFGEYAAICHLPLTSLKESNFSCLRGCLHDTEATFSQERVHNGYLSWLYICLHDTTTKCHIGASHLGARSPRFLYGGENFTPVRNLATVWTGSPDVVCVNILIFTWTKWYEPSKLTWTEIVQKSKYNKTKLRYLYVSFFFLAG